MPMDPEDDFYPEDEPQRSSQSGVLREADVYVRENPIPVVLGALAVGFAIGLLVRVLERERREPGLRDHLEDAEEYLGALFSPAAKKAKRAYRKSSAVVRDAVEEAVDAVRDIDVEDYTDPVAKWFRRWWKKCCD
jgi:hypothetical protein